MTLDELLNVVIADEVARLLAGPQRFPDLAFIRRVMEDARPRGIEATVWVAPTPQSLNRHDVRLLTFGRFRSAYTVIERMAHVLTPAALELDVLPTILPFDPRHLRGMTEDTPFIRRVRERGALLYRSRGR